MKRIFKHKKLIIIGIVLLLAVLFLRSSGLSQVKTAQVKKVSVINNVVTKTVSASGTVKSPNEADLSFATGQKIANIYINKGDLVKKGQLLAMLDTQSNLQTAQAYKDARDIALRERDLFLQNMQANIKSSGGQDQFDTKLREYNEKISQAESTYQAQLAIVKSANIYAPFAGTVIDVTKKIGETATPGEIVIKLADLSVLDYEADIDQADYSQLKQAMPADISLDAFPDYTFKGKVTYLPLYADGSSNNSFTIKISFTDLTDKLPLLGMTGDVKIITSSTTTEVPSLYYDQIYTDEQSKPYVWVYDNGYVSKYPIQIGLEGDIYTEVKSKIDKQIIVPLTSDIDIKDGYKAKIVK